MSHINVSEVLSSLSLAKEAYEALPDLRRQIDDLQAALASKDRLISQTQSTLEETIQGKANVEAKLKQTEEERDAYGFRAIDAEEKLEKVFGVVRPMAPPPQPPVVDQSATDPTVQTVPTTSGVGSVDTAASSSTEPGQSEAGPTSTTTGTTADIADTKPSEPVLNPTQEWGKQSDSGDETTSNVVDKPFLGHPSWEKPHDMPWHEWEVKGGTVPGWMKQSG